MIDDRKIEYLLWAPDRASFLAVMAALQNPLTGEPLAVETEGRLVASDGVRIDEIGPVVKTPAAYDDDGNQLTSGEIVPGHHVNLVAVGALAGLLTSGMPGEGDVFQRTRILSLLGEMDWQPSAVGEPPGLVGTSGVKIYDPATVNHRVRVWA